MAIKEAQSLHQSAYGGTHGNVGVAQLMLSGGAAANDVIKLGKLPMGLVIKSVTAGCDKAAASATLDVAMISDDGTSKTLATALDINNKMSQALVVPTHTDFDTGKAEIQATLKGGPVAAGTVLYVNVEYVILGTQ